MKHRMALRIFTRIARYEIEVLREVVEFTEGNLKGEMKRLEKRVAQRLDRLSEEERQQAVDWYEDDFVRLDRVYPQILRRALFTTLMCMTEAIFSLCCSMCKRAFEIRQDFKVKGKARAITQAMEYLRTSLTIREDEIKEHWNLVQTLWPIRNALVHNDGKPKPQDREPISKFCASTSTFELDHLGRIILKQGSLEFALDAVDRLFSSLIDEIKRDTLPNTPPEGMPPQARQP